MVVPHPLARRDDEECRRFAAASTEEIVSALTGDAVELEATYRDKRIETRGRLRHRSLFESDFNAPDAPEIIRVPDRLDTVDRLFYQRGWTDGLPIVPPTPERYRALLGDLDPGELLGLVEPRLGRATVAKVVANAVMAGCRPEHVHVVVAATRAMCEPRFNLKALQSTTHPCTVMCLVGGPIVDEIDLNASYNAMGQGQRANAVIGRAIRLILTNIGGAAPGVLDRSTMGSPAKYSFCFAENVEANPWETFHAELGLEDDASHVTVFGAEGPHNVNDHHGRTGEDLLLTIAGTLASPGANNFYLGGQAVVVIGPEHAEVIARDGFSKADVKRFLSERAIIPRSLVSEASVDLLEMRLPDHLLGPRGRDGVQLITDPANVIVLVAGGAGRHSAIMPTFGQSTQSVTERI
ncbi:MAG: hypothetical protein OXI90_08860 [Gammaproteobacteria bacterium]|nr:hypothetical protein [Gammaproteobacteria bacterium]